ncbi:uncharacterized protein LOC133800492 [Humulus lupulus]|uniref:uncharacterized protein LOC133800492 n=1 Tax=Humulus lupulus TaxID=3486 RepID=UPI002B410E40|nr:uncharacterized protein LOC133800492 [Humulus lupulus]
MESDQRERHHLTTTSSSSGGGGTSELFICFTSRLSSSSMKISSKSILSPGRARDSATSQISLSSSLSRRLRTSGSLKGAAGAGQASPMFPTGGKKRGSASFENPEPSSPKVTCIGQVRVKTKKQSKKIRNRSKRRSGGGEASFRRAEQSLQEASLSSSSSNHNSSSHQSNLQHQHQHQHQGADQGLPHRNQKWVHLPLTICEALRAFGSEFNCFLPCRSSCTSNNTSHGEHKESSIKEERRARSENVNGGSSCGAAFARWLVSVQDGDHGKRREIELVVGEDDEEQRRMTEMMRGSSQRRQVFEGIEFRDEPKEEQEEEDEDDDEEEEEEEEEEEKGRVSICIPPKNALLLMRCRSDPVKMAALANRFWESPVKKDEGDEDENKVEEEEEHEEQLNCEEDLEGKEVIAVEEVAVESELVIYGDEVCDDDDDDDEEEEEKEEKFVCTDNENPKEEKEEKVDNLEALLHKNEDENNGEVMSSESKALLLEEPEEEPEKDSEKEDVIQLQTDNLAGESTDFNGCSSEIPVVTIVDPEKSEVYDEENAVKPGLEEDQTLEVYEKEEEEQEESSKPEEEEEEKEEELEMKVTEGSTEQEEDDSEPELEPEQAEACEEKTGRDSRENGSGLPDCLLLMMCEPKLSMEVSKETWVCSTDFIRWIPDRRPNPKKVLGPGPGVEEPKKRPSIVVNGPNSGLPPLQPPRSSVSFPVTAAAPQSMASMIEQKLVGSKPYEPFVLTRCKSEPMRSAAATKLAQEACFWKNRKLEPHHPASLGLGAAAGVGF